MLKSVEASATLLLLPCALPTVTQVIFLLDEVVLLCQNLQYSRCFTVKNIVRVTYIYEATLNKPHLCTYASGSFFCCGYRYIHCGQFVLSSRLLSSFLFFLFYSSSFLTFSYPLILSPILSFSVLPLLYSALIFDTKRKDFGILIGIVFLIT